MARAKVAGSTLAAALVLSIGSSTLTAPNSTAAPLTLSPVTCDANAIHIYVPYYPNTYCYSGIGSRTVNLTQVSWVESHSWTMTVGWEPPGGSYRQTGLLSNQSLNIQGGTVEAISVP